MKHRFIPQHETEKLAKEIADADYDSLHQFLHHLSNKLLQDSEVDRKKGRRSLATNLQSLAYQIKNATSSAKEIANQCRPYNQKQNS